MFANFRPVTGGKDISILVSGVVMAAYSLFHLWLSVIGVLATLQQVYIHLTFALVIIFLIKPAFAAGSRLAHLRWAVDLPCIIGAILLGAHMTLNFMDIADRGGGDPSMATVVLGGVAVLLTIEATRRMMGLALPIITAIFIAYAFLGPYLPGALAHRGYGLERVVSMLYATTSGIAGTPLQTSASYVAIFVIFAGFLDASGAGKFFIDWSFAGLGWMRGGPAKVAVIASALMGTVSGSSVANVAATGTFTIPVMKRAGLKKAFAGAVEAAASSGGQIMPPVMGAAAFIMVEIMGAPYTSIMKAAIVPGLLYFLAVFCMIDFQVAKQGIKGIPKQELPDAWEIFKEGWHLILPLILLLYLLIYVEYTPIKSAFWSVVAVVAISWMRGRTRMGPARIFQALRQGGKSMLEVATACASAGIVVGVMLLTGLALRLSSLMVDWSGGNLMPLLLITMVISLILGMGLPTSAVYIVLATMVVPAMTAVGVDPMAAHLFVFYFGVLANVTPPVAIAAFAGAGIAGADPMKTGVIAFRIALAGFILPFMWVYNPAIILDGAPLQIAIAVLTATIGIISLAAAVQGYLFGNARWFERLLLLGGSLTLIMSGVSTDLAGFAMIGLAVATRFLIPGVNRRPERERLTADD
ncbi:TRAP transporter permease [Pikeienuella sp. HZG-20]|uniref:TRAP transporter permease n=1 Tax=Paludibacillus litoralis TaxID=3133267 RepID=UPI0030EDFD3E